MDNQYEPFVAFASWNDVVMRDGVDGDIASFFSHASPAEDDDASSIASNDDEPVVAQSFPKKSFPTFEDLRASVLSFARLAPSQVADNSRCASKVESFPTKWMRVEEIEMIT
jgi:phospholipase C